MYHQTISDFLNKLDLSNLLFIGIYFAFLQRYEKVKNLFQDIRLITLDGILLSFSNFLKAHPPIPQYFINILNFL